MRGMWRPWVHKSTITAIPDSGFQSAPSGGPEHFVPPPPEPGTALPYTATPAPGRVKLVGGGIMSAGAVPAQLACPSPHAETGRQESPGLVAGVGSFQAPTSTGRGRSGERSPRPVPNRRWETRDIPSTAAASAAGNRPKAAPAAYQYTPGSAQAAGAGAAAAVARLGLCGVGGGMLSVRPPSVPPFNPVMCKMENVVSVQRAKEAAETAAGACKLEVPATAATPAPADPKPAPPVLTPAPRRSKKLTSETLESMDDADFQTPEGTPTSTAAPSATAVDELANRGTDVASDREVASPYPGADTSRH